MDLNGESGASNLRNLWHKDSFFLPRNIAKSLIRTWTSHTAPSCALTFLASVTHQTSTPLIYPYLLIG